MKNFLSNMSEREKWLVIAGATFAFFFIYYSLIYSPLITAVDTNSKKLVELQETLQWMKKINPEEVKGGGQQVLNNNQLLNAISTQLKELPELKFPYQIQQTGSGEVQLSFEQVPFEPLVLWLSRLSEKYALTIKQFNAERSETTGIVRVLIVISAPGK